MEVASPSSPGFDLNAIFENARRGSLREDIDFFDAEFTPLIQIDLQNYSNGMDVIIEEHEMSGQILFIPKPHYM